MDQVLQWFRFHLLKWLCPFIQWVGRTHMPCSRKAIKAAHYYDLQPNLTPGMVFCTHTDGEMSNLLIPGDWSHAAMYVGGNKVVEAVGSGVRLTDLIDFMLTKDVILVRRPLFAAAQTLMDIAVKWAMDQVGKPYDWQFRSDLKAFYCAELVGAAYQFVLGGKSPFVVRETLGEKTITPQDIADAHDKWHTVWDSRLFKVET